ncbi:MAG TPA: NADH-quinone oxidoreductase subunit NuoH [Gemmataceae bacterium]|jgi:NADH-quinone oxidoreductase subunit H|nr:NADH-quinone oxidoreductase subunit NuoH [Gemmataceae bacterium]
MMIDWLWAHHLVVPLIVMVLAMGTLLGGTLYLVHAERKISAYMQDRIGPNRLGWGGVFQPIADGAKIFLKEDLVPAHVDKLFFMTAPGIAAGTALLALAVVPLGPTAPPPAPVAVQVAPNSPGRAEAEQAAAEKFQRLETAYHNTPKIMIAPGVDIGLLFNFAVGSLAVYGIILGGWSSNNKYSLLGSLRSSAQIISYEIPMGTAILAVLLYTGSLNLEKAIDSQAGPGGIGWHIIYQPLTFLMFMTAVFAECNRLPFDLPEAEQELVGGYHTEYSSLKFVLFYLGEYIHMVTVSFLMTVLFFGGWHLPWVSDIGGAGSVLNSVVRFLIMAGKVSFFILFFMLIRWTLPRFRYDQLMGLAWRTLIPLSLVNLVLVMIVRELNWSHWLLLPIQIALLIGAAALTLRRSKPPAVIRTGKHPSLIGVGE